MGSKSTPSGPPPVSTAQVDPSSYMQPLMEQFGAMTMQMQAQQQQLFSDLQSQINAQPAATRQQPIDWQARREEIRKALSDEQNEEQRKKVNRLTSILTNPLDDSQEQGDILELKPT